jgi:hypothetical protein
MVKRADLGEDAVMACAAVNGDIAVTLAITVVLDVKAEIAGALLHHLHHQAQCVVAPTGKQLVKVAVLNARTMTTVLLVNHVTRTYLLAEALPLTLLLTLLPLTLLHLLHQPQAEPDVDQTGKLLTLDAEKHAVTTTIVLEVNPASRIWLLALVATLLLLLNPPDLFQLDLEAFRHSSIKTTLTEHSQPVESTSQTCTMN